ncbi:MAG: lipase maturation factor family protein [Halioglobus sp.]|nr:lipase maturation factor family protein [Halioglobus sp.]
MQRPLLIYDGDCAFCRYCVDYARSATGEAVDYQPYQVVGRDFPAIGEDEFRSAIKLVRRDGAVSSGAQAALQTLALGRRGRVWATLYAVVPWFAACSDWCYRWVAAHRGACLRLCQMLFGERLEVASTTLVNWLFLRLLGLIYLAAFISITLQARGLVGADGLLPIADFLAVIDHSYGPEKYRLLPTLLWLDDSDTAIVAIGVVGCLLAAALFLDVLPRLCLVGLYVCYLSLYHAGQLFLSYQWDVLLLECGFLAIFLSASPRLFTWLYRWLLFRFLLQSGLVKLLSGDPTWRDLSALQYHFHTQPLPTVLAWYADKLPQVLLQAGVVFTFVIELLVPFLILMPRRPRALAAWCITLFQLSIIATGSYNFFNLLTIGLCLLLLDDRYAARYCPAGLRRRASASGPENRMTGSAALCALVAVAYIGLTSVLLAATGGRQALDGLPRQLLSWSEPFHIANGYGLFAVMTTRRDEIVWEGSRDGRSWRAYVLPYQPGPLERPPVWAAPYQPRLDWQLWFAALAPREQNPWLRALVRGLLTGADPVLALFDYNPFPGSPPRYLRASLYHYRFSDWRTRRATGQWWVREYAGVFWPVTAWQLPVERAGGREPAGPGMMRLHRREIEDSFPSRPAMQPGIRQAPGLMARAAGVRRPPPAGHRPRAWHSGR